jgi:hypothetical protein
LEIPLPSIRLRIEVLKEVSFNVSFEILVAVTGVCTLLFSRLVNSTFFNTVVSFVTAFLVILFFLNLMMILKNIHKLLTTEIEIQARLVEARALKSQKP